MASAAADISFEDLTAAQLRQWVNEHPGGVEDQDISGWTALYSAAYKGDVALVQWLIDAHGADVNGRTMGGVTALYRADTPDMVRALLERNADPALPDEDGWTVLMVHAYGGNHECVACLLENRLVVESINARVGDSLEWARGFTAFHFACASKSHSEQPTILRLLLAAGADPRMLDGQGRTHLQIMRRHGYAYSASATVLEEEVPDAERAAYLLRIRRLVVKKQGAELSEEEEGGVGEEEAEWRRLAAFVAGLGAGGGCGRDVFTVVMDMLLPLWAPLRKGLGKK